MIFIQWLKKNKTWVFSGIGVAIISSVIWLFFGYREDPYSGQRQWTPLIGQPEHRVKL